MGAAKAKLKRAKNAAKTKRRAQNHAYLIHQIKNKNLNRSTDNKKHRTKTTQYPT